MATRYRTIIIEDESAIRDLLAISARLRNHEVLSFERPLLCTLSHREPCACVSGTSCSDVLITDYMMPDMTGLELLEILEEKKCLIPCRALITALDSADVIRRARDLGCRVFLKPFQVSEVCSWLEESESRVAKGRTLLAREKVVCP